MPRHSLSLVAVLVTMTAAAPARRVHAQYTLDRHPAVAADSAGTAVLRTLRADLSRLRLAQDSFYVAHHRYAADTSALGTWRPTSGALIRITSADSTGWVAEAEHWQLIGAEVLTVRRTTDQPRR